MSKRQKPKGQAGMGNRAYHAAMVEIRRSNATTPVPSGKRYVRKPKHTGAGW